MYPMVMHSGSVLASALGNASLAQICDQRAAAAGRDFVAALYNGEFFSYGAQLNGTGRTDDVIFSGMMAGQMLSRHAGFGDLPNVPFAKFQSSMRAQLGTHVAQSYNFYPPKVYVPFVSVRTHGLGRSTRQCCRQRIVCGRYERAYTDAHRYLTRCIPTCIQHHTVSPTYIPYACIPVIRLCVFFLGYV